ncbi:Methyl-CpG-binding domain-containing protein 7 [Striga hermonthica]|uniref:Methyl-CpG-binding domain-containing protein 7 n=1 Tax=Striga hermonthica TaxID=68872 RepID=A0A9N7REV7_STRHE|nr:Methyl-CpG-binding domain-containing protein 7 [Striga hermonthica]
MLITYSRRRQAVAPPISASDRLQVPSGWGVEQVPRRNGSQIDTYYYEPGTGRKFRSITEVLNYLNGQGYPRRRSTRRSTHFNSARHQRMLVSGGKLFRVDDDDDDDEVRPNRLAIVPYGKSNDMSSFVLPDGWIVEEVPRRYSSSTDKYYYEPGTGRQFRSMVAVKRHLAESQQGTHLLKGVDEIKENEPNAPKVLELENHSKNLEKEVGDPEQNTQESSVMDDPPMEVRWVLASPQGDKWNPFINGKMVPDAVKQQWMDKFVRVIKEGND